MHQLVPRLHIDGHPMSSYPHTLTVFAPQTSWLGMNSLAALFGESKVSDLNTFRYVTHTRNGVSYQHLTTNVTERVKSALQLHQAGRLLITADTVDPQELPEQTVVFGRPEWDTDNQIDMAAAGASLAGALVLFSLDADNAPAYSGQTIIALNVPFEAMQSTFGFSLV